MIFDRAAASGPSFLPAAVGALLLSPFAAGAAEPVASSPGGPPTAAMEAVGETAGEDDDFTDYLVRRQVILGGGAIFAPEYEGSDKFKLTPVPLISFSFNESIIVDPRGLEFTVFSRDALSFRLSAHYDGGRDEDDSDILEGLGDIDGGVLLGGTMAYQLGQVELYGTLEQTIGEGGLQAVAGAVVTQRRGDFLLSAGASATWANGDYMSTYFGVTPAQSDRSGLAPHDADAGLKRVDAEVFATYLMTRHWALRTQLGLGYLVGDAGDSPIVQDRLQPNAMMILGYRF